MSSVLLHFVRYDENALFQSFKMTDPICKNNCFALHVYDEFYYRMCSNPAC